MHLLGVSRRQVGKWIRLNWLKPLHGRIPERDMIRFRRRHPEQYQLNRVDEAWFKGLLFPAFNTATSGRDIVPGPMVPEDTQCKMPSNSISNSW
jgi:hypothetical protein